MNAVFVDTKAKFECAHGRAPRGDADWCFEIGGEWYYMNGLYSVAKKLAVKIARENGKSLVTLMA